MPSRRLTAKRFCRCVTSVRKTLRPRKGSTKEQGAIGVCVKSMLHTRKKTIRNFKCGKRPVLKTQPYKR